MRAKNSPAGVRPPPAAGDDRARWSKPKQRPRVAPKNNGFTNNGGVGDGEDKNLERGCLCRGIVAVSVLAGGRIGFGRLRLSED